MNTGSEARALSFSPFEQLRYARSIIQHEADALAELAGRLDSGFCTAVEQLSGCSGSIVVTGIGKAGLIGQKIAATFSSTGSRSHFLHPSEAVHGDLGCLHDDDMLLALSNSGESEEVCRLIEPVRRLQVPIVAVTASESSTLGRSADVVVRLGRLQEAGPFGLAPTTSTTGMLALGDALALVLSRLKQFTPQGFAVFHPAGSLGRKLMSIRAVMRSREELRVAEQQESVRAVFARHNKPGRRSGAIVLVDAQGRLKGLFTDSDLARLLEQHREDQLDRPISEVMTLDPYTIEAEATLNDAVCVLSEKKVSELPVVDEGRRPIGLIDITDVIGLMPQDE